MKSWKLPATISGRQELGKDLDHGYRIFIMSSTLRKHHSARKTAAQSSNALAKEDGDYSHLLSMDPTEYFELVNAPTSDALPSEYVPPSRTRMNVRWESNGASQH